MGVTPLDGGRAPPVLPKNSLMSKTADVRPNCRLITANGLSRLLRGARRPIETQLAVSEDSAETVIQVNYDKRVSDFESISGSIFEQSLMRSLTCGVVVTSRFRHIRPSCRLDVP